MPDSRFEEWECYKLSDCDFDKQCQGTPGRCIDPVSVEVVKVVEGLDMIVVPVHQ